MSPQLRQEHATGLRRGVGAAALVFAVSMLGAIYIDGLDVDWVRQGAKAAIEGLAATGVLAAYGVRDAARNDAQNPKKAEP